MRVPATLASLAAFEHYAHLREQVENALQQQAHYVAERSAFYVERPDIDQRLDHLLASHHCGVFILDGPPGAGISTMLCHLAASRPAACWFPARSGKAGLHALCAQVIALCDLQFALVPPAAARDAGALERLLTEAGATRPPGAPLLVLLDTPFEHQALANLLPTSIPAGVVVVMARPATHTFLPPATATLAFPAAGPAVLAQLRDFCLQCGCTSGEAARIAEQAHGSFLYARIVATQVATGQRVVADLPASLEALHSQWWQQLDALDRQIMQLLAAARIPIDPTHLGQLTGLTAEAHQRAARWFPLVELTGQGVALHHGWTRAFVERVSGDGLAAAHGQHARFLAEHPNGARTAFDDYAPGEYARHVALSNAETRVLLAPDLTSRNWIMSQERRFGTMDQAADDMQWAIEAVAAMPPLLLARAAALGGMLTLLSRRLAPAAVVRSLELALERGVPREQSVRRLRSMIDQVPDGRDKALLLRALGEVCYTLRMRATAMRMLSEALDLETHGLPRSWRDQREETLVALARAAVTHGWPDTALGITTLITHAERRGLVDTEVVRWLIAAGQHTRAEEVAYAIGHAGTHEWAMAEVAVGHARAGDFERAGVVFDTLRTDTAIAWAATELGCDSAANGNPRAVDRVAMLRPQALRDRALAQVAQALATHHMAIEAFAAVTLIEDFDVRLRALVAMAEADPECAPTALSGASRALDQITGDERASVIAVLASAYASTGRLDQALATAALLPPGEEHDRACSRISTALGRRGDQVAASTVAMEIADDDERSWALDELARLVGSGGQWHEAFALAAQITDDTQRAQTESDLAIAWARAGHAVAAHARALQIGSMAERLRALIAITNELASEGTRAAAFIRFAQLGEPEARSRYLAAAATALAAQRALGDAKQAAVQATRPLDRARSHAAIAQAAAEQGQLAVAQSLLAEALREVAWLGRSEALACLGWAGETLALLGGADLLLNVASTLDELDSWWSN